MAVCVILDILVMPAAMILMNVRSLRLSVKEGAYAQTWMEASTVHVQSRAWMNATLAVAAPALEEEPVAVMIQMISAVNVLPDTLECVVKIFKASRPCKIVTKS